jgi:hypothetical protein
MTFDQIADRVELPVDDVQRHFLETCERLREMMERATDGTGEDATGQRSDR